MNQTDVTTDGLRNVRPGREALTGVHTGVGPPPAPGGRRRAGRAETPMVPDARFSSYYGLPVINKPVWEARDIAGYLFLGGLAGASSLVGALAHLEGRAPLARVAKAGAAGAAGLSLVALVHDLGRPARFLNMLRTLKPTSPMSVGSWVLAGFGPAAMAAAACDLTGLLPGVGVAATAGAAALGPPLATYTAALVANTAVPAWHDARNELPFVFAASAMCSAAGLALVGAPVETTAAMRLLGAAAGAGELVTEQVMERRMGMAAGAYSQGKAKRYRRLARPLVLAGALGAAAGRRNRVVNALAGASLLAGSALTRFAIFHAGVASATDPAYTVVPQRARLDARGGVPTSLRE